MGIRTPLAIACLALAPMAQAQDSRNWDGEAELGFLMTSGNTDETKLDGRLGLKHETETWRNTGDFRSRYTEAEDQTTAEEYKAALEADYKFDEQQYWFVRGAYEDDRFSGYDFESTLTTGYGNRVWQQGDRSFLDLSIGGGYRYNKLREDDVDGSNTEEEAIARLAGQFDYALSESALFRQKLSTEIGLDENNTISQSETSLQSSIVGSLSMKLAYRVKHVSDAPAGSDKTDTETSLSLLYGF
ncbi:MAG: putative salt-induced outer membrane protein [Marinobacter excellens HL-55]|uniref:Putative salt-induced outer membrane protein n=1 Tax=Marinobacter excellens HL-55 TaxID=1305731 RepID=A0A0P7YZN1_9GAMM|nr:MAG: putative salt-induced outer membrane protein [Marinobacter excellens HL-55]